MAYPEVTETGKDRLARGHFSDAIAIQTIREGIFRANPSTLEEARRAALLTEIFEQMEAQRSGIVELQRKKYRMHNLDEQIRNTVKTLVDEQLSSQGPLSPPEATPTQRKQDTRIYRPRPKRQAASDDLCFRCKGQGHVAWEYPAKRSNAETVNDAYPVPRIALAGARWFSTLDLASGYWQVELDKDAKRKSAFVVRRGLYSWGVMHFGLWRGHI